jgi:hypothetical protein
VAMVLVAASMSPPSMVESMPRSYGRAGTTASSGGLIRSPT